MIENKTIVVWFSCGAASAAAAYFTLKRYGANNKVILLNNPVAEEHEDNERFITDCEKWLKTPITKILNPKYPDHSCETVWNKRKYMSGPMGAPCTVELKKRARQHWENNNHADYHVFGFTSEELKRHNRFKLNERDNILPILIEEGYSKQDCINLLEREGIEVPYMYKLGYPNNNCIGCVKATSPTYWNHVRKVHPEVFNKRLETSEKLGVKLVQYKGERISLKDLDPEAKGRKLKSMVIECGLFCEEPE